jgi:DNA-binding transcriptional ArsR family regulator
VSKESGEYALENVLRALGNPIRRQILHALVDGPGSATTISRELELNLGVVSYHLNEVLFEDCGLVELFEAIQRRGALEKFYRLKFDPAVDGRPDGQTLSLGECFMATVMAEGESPSPPPPAS